WGRRPILPRRRFSRHFDRAMIHCKWTRWDVEELGPAAVGGRPVIVAAQPGGTQFLGAVGERHGLLARVDLDILVRIVVYRQSGLLIDALGPGDPIHIWLGQKSLPVGAFHRIIKSVSSRVGDQLAR